MVLSGFSFQRQSFSRSRSPHHHHQSLLGCMLDLSHHIPLFIFVHMHNLNMYCILIVKVYVSMRVLWVNSWKGTQTTTTFLHHTYSSTWCTCLLLNAHLANLWKEKKLYKKSSYCCWQQVLSFCTSAYTFVSQRCSVCAKWHDVKNWKTNLNEKNACIRMNPLQILLKVHKYRNMW